MPKKLKVGVNQTVDENLGHMAENMINSLAAQVIGGDAKGTLRLTSRSQRWIDLGMIS